MITCDDLSGGLSCMSLMKMLWNELDMTGYESSHHDKGTWQVSAVQYNDVYHIKTNVTVVH